MAKALETSAGRRRGKRPGSGPTTAPARSDRKSLTLACDPFHSATTASFALSVGATVALDRMESSTENLSSATPPSRTENLDKPGHIRGSSLSSPPPPLSSSSANVLRSLPPSVPSAPPSKRSSASASQVSLPFPTHNRGNSVSTFGDVAASGDDLFAVERPSGEAEREEDDEDVGGESKSKTTDVVDQLGILALSARMTEVDMMVQEVSLLLFEIQVGLTHLGLPSSS